MYNESTARDLRTNRHLELIEDIHPFKPRNTAGSDLPLSDLAIDARLIMGVLASIFAFILIAVLVVGPTTQAVHDSGNAIATVGIMIQPGDSLESITSAHMLPSGDYDETRNWIIKKNALDAYSMLPIGLPITVPSA